ncbi:hypothetical protein [Rhodoferax sp. UBA5149]|uniref:hypothetical protein n=1 Tax=Rhodoferax sp. UBA5149 TaxID=1947379 RepID=UPI0025CD87E7|nr:hypothetical protein [Rhodoferax sp. UBA5149]
MENSESRTDLGQALGEISATLFELRDALVELSLSLKDWQFENDVEQQKSTGTTLQQLLQKIMSVQDPLS